MQVVHSEEMAGANDRIRDLEASEAGLSKAEAGLSRLQDETTSLRDKAVSLQDENASLQAGLSSQQDENATLRDETTSLRDTTVSLQDEKASLQDAIKRLQGVLEESLAAGSETVATLERKVDARVGEVEEEQAALRARLESEQVRPHHTVVHVGLRRSFTLA